VKTQTLSIKGSEKIGLISNLATMLSAGIPILEVVNSLLEDAKGNPKRILEQLKADLMQGKHVSTSFEQFPGVFDAVTVNVIKASEEAGTLDITLRDVKQTLTKEMEFTDKIRSALVYPAFISLVFGGVLLLILIVVVPKIATVFSRLRTELPLPTRLLIFFSNALLHNTVWVIGGFGILGIGAYVLFKLKRSIVFDVLFSLPLISQLVKEIDLTRFSRSLYLLLSSGLPIIAALELTSRVAGKTLSEGFRLTRGYFPTIMIKLMESGEKTGTLDRSMQDISEYFDYQVTNTLKTLTALLEPIMLVLVGIVIGGMMLAIIAPIYGLIGQVGQR